MTSKGAEKMKIDTIGVDILKDHFDAHRLADGGAGVSSTTRAAIGLSSNGWPTPRWIASSSSRPVPITGPSSAPGHGGRSFAKVNPRQARRFAEAVGTLAKTDRLDAAMLARMGALLELRPTAAERSLARTQGASSRPRSLGERPHGRQEPQKALTARLLKRQNTLRLEQIERQMTAIEAAILEQIHADPDFPNGSRSSTAFRESRPHRLALLIEMPELGASTPDRRQVSQAWPDRPAVRPWTGHAFIRGAPPSPPGRLHARACRHPIQPRHEGQVQATDMPEAAKVALTAVMRKLIVLANALLKANRRWPAKPA